jgi:DNA invertase Pin-like site-specific DNA recombinase
MTAAQEILPMAPTAYSLIRYSQPHQKAGDSQRRQNDFAERWCRENGARLDKDLSMLLDGDGAFRGNHRRKTGRRAKPFAEFLEDIENKLVLPGSILIVENVDRLSREEIDEAWELLRSILRAGIDVVTERPERRYAKKSLNNFAEILELKFAMYLAHEESAKKSERVGKAWREKKRRAAEARTPVGRSCPAWIRLVDANGAPVPRGRRPAPADRYELIPERAAVVRRIFALAAEMGSFRIAGLLAAEGVPCFGRKRKWLPEYVRLILREPPAYGAYQPRGRDAKGKIGLAGDPIPGYYPAVVTEQEWRAANAVIRGRYRTCGQPGEDEANLFTGVLFDARSRERLHKRPTWKQGKRYEYLVAPRAEQRAWMPYRPVEEWLVRCLGGLRAEHVLPPGEEADARLRRISELSREVMALAGRLATLEAQQIDPATDPDLLPSLQGGIVEARRRQRERTRELRALEEEANTSLTKWLGACQSVLSLLDTPERRRTAKARIRQLVESIWLVVQPVRHGCRVVHAQIYLRGGRRVYRTMRPDVLPPSFALWRCKDADFRAGDIGDDAVNALRPEHLVG